MSENFGEAFTHPDAANSKGTESALKRFLGKTARRYPAELLKNALYFRKNLNSFSLNFL